MGKKEWRESSDGPDIMDVMTMIGALEALHSAHVALIVSPHGTGSGIGADINLNAIFEVLPGSSLPAGVGVGIEYPGKYGESFWGMVYSLCWKLDEEISKVYKNESLWK